jgi:hypothetical protein
MAGWWFKKAGRVASTNFLMKYAESQKGNSLLQ